METLQRSGTIDAGSKACVPRCGAMCGSLPLHERWVAVVRKGMLRTANFSNRGQWQVAHPRSENRVNRFIHRENSRHQRSGPGSNGSNAAASGVIGLGGGGIAVMASKISSCSLGSPTT